jgi:CBS domain containing-hemolysin-like protein
VWLLNASASSIGKLFNLSLATEGDEIHSEEELILIANQSFIKGEINEKEYEYLNNVFEFDDLIAKDIMVSRLDMETIPVDVSIEEALKFAIKKGHTRFPIIAKTKDDILGYVTLQNLIKEYLTAPGQEIKKIMQEPIIFIDTIPVKLLLSEMQKEHKHFAILLDEYGGTSGLVTIEDILEELVGDIQDEEDHEKELVVKLSPTTYQVDGKLLLSEFEELFNIDLAQNNLSKTISGFITNYSLEQNEPLEVGQTFEFDNLKITIIEMDKITPHILEVKRV